MLSFPAAIKVYLCTVACDMRCSFDGLSMMAEHVIHCNPFSGHLLVFCNRRSDRLKILYWDRDGGRSGTRGWKRVLSSFLSPRPGGRRSRPGSWVCGWKESILVRGGEENATACPQRQRNIRKARTRLHRKCVPENLPTALRPVPTGSLGNHRRSLLSAPLGEFVLHRGPKQLVMVLQTLHVVRGFE